VAYYSVRTTPWQRLGNFFRGLPGSRALPWRYVVGGVSDAADEVPDKLVLRTAVIVQSGDRQTWLVFDCPRHLGERIMLNLSTRRRPSWKIGAESVLSVYPSVDAAHAGARCHFWLRRGRIDWAKEDTRGPERYLH
jgi:hypothetical protein